MTSSQRPWPLDREAGRITEYINAKYKEDQFVNIVKSHGSNQTIMNSTIKIITEVVEELSPKMSTVAQKEERFNIQKQD